MNGFTIALVYDLRSEYRALGYSEEAIAEFDTEETIECLSASLGRLGHHVTTIGNARALARCLADGCRYDLVFSIAEGLAGRAREAQVPALCELYDQPYTFSDPMTMTVALDKAVAKRIARDAGVATAPFAVSEDGGALPAFDFAYPVFVKPIAEGTGKGCDLNSLCRDAGALRTAIADLHARFRQPLIIEPFLPGREFTVGIVDGVSGPEIVGSLEIVLNAEADAGIYTQRNKESSETLVSYVAANDVIVRAAESCALDAYRALECRDAARIDIRCDANGHPSFLEANPLPGLHPTHSDLPMAATAAGHSYDWLLNAIVSSAARRYRLDAVPARPRAPRREFVPVLHAADTAREDEADTLDSAERVRASLEQCGFVSEIVRFVPEAGSVAALARRQPRAVFNLVEAVDGHSAASLLAPWYLARHELPFTGNGFEGLLATASKLLAKAAMQSAGIATPGVCSDAGAGELVILKPVWEHASLGIDATSVIPAAQRARALAEREAEYATRFFAESFVDGREFNVSLLDDGQRVRVLPIQETLFVDWPAERARVVDFEAKWAPDSLVYRNTPRHFGLEAAEPELAHKLAACARKVWNLFDLSGYARIDLRVDSAGMPFVIDVNANPGLGPDAGFVAAAAAAGLDFDALIAALLGSALARRLAA